MISFSLFKLLMEGKPKPTYVPVIPDDASIHRIYGLMEEIGLPGKDRVVPSDLHTTVIYSNSPISNPSKTIREFMPITATGDDLTVFDTRSGKKCLVLKLSSVSLRALHVEIRREYGASHDFPTFEPHVTLCYDLPDDFSVPKKIDPITIEFRAFKVKELDPDWKPK